MKNVRCIILSVTASFKWGEEKLPDPLIRVFAVKPPDFIPSDLYVGSHSALTITSGIWLPNIMP
jgi:hypothetical protein